jgi:serine/threonine-protein kinase
MPIGNVPSSVTNRPMLARGRVLRSPETSDEFRIVRELGSGGFGSVYLCHRVDDPTVRLAAKVTYDQQCWVRELYFGDLLADTPGVIHIQDAFPLMGTGANRQATYVAVMDLADGGDLYDLLSRTQQPISQSRAVTMVRRVLGALAHLHESGAFHRDLTPANVFLDDKGRTVLGDFGIAQHRVSRKGVPATVFNRWYCPPEIDVTTSLWCAEQDIWQVGQLLAVMLQGDPDALVEPGGVRHLPCDPWLREVIYRAVGPQAARFRSAREMSKALQSRTLAVDTLPKAHPRSLDGLRLVFTAGIPGLPRPQATKRAKRAGAEVQRDVSYSTDLIVLGANAPLYAAGSGGGKLMSAVALNEIGARIRLLSASQFLSLT